MSNTVFHLEKFDHFVSHIAGLNQLYAPEDESLSLLASEASTWQEITAGTPEPDAHSPLANAVASRKSLHLVHRGFPEQAPLHEQAAYVIRGVTGLAPFAEANFRTGWDYACEMLSHASHTIEATNDEMRELGASLWMELQELNFNGDHLGARDTSFQTLASWLHSRIA